LQNGRLKVVRVQPAPGDLGLRGAVHLAAGHHGIGVAVDGRVPDGRAELGREADDLEEGGGVYGAGLVGQEALVDGLVVLGHVAYGQLAVGLAEFDVGLATEVEELGVLVPSDVGWRVGDALACDGHRFAKVGLD